MSETNKTKIVNEEEYYEFTRWKDRQYEIVSQERMDKAYTLGVKSANKFLKFIKGFILEIPSSYKDNEEYDSFLDGFTQELDDSQIILDNIKLKRIKGTIKNANKK